MGISTATQDEVSLDEALYWRVLKARDSRFDGAFVYGVSSTGMYCLPSCRNRAPRRDRVVFFHVPEAAERAGFRPCLRCRPQEAWAPDPAVELVLAACQRLHEYAEACPTLAELGAEVGASPSTLRRAFKRVLGITPWQYADALRLERVKLRLRTEPTIASALYEAGYGSSSRLYEQAVDKLGMTPLIYRSGGQGWPIAYTVVGCPLGRLLVAATRRGVCAIRLGDTDDALEAGIQREFPAAALQRDAEGLRVWVEASLGYLRGEIFSLDIPLDIRATAFQRQVWEALCRIPYGQTRTYRQIAEEVGRPAAARAVGRACAANPVPLVVPCHRVVRGDGMTGGYRYGPACKRALLALEQNRPDQQANR